MVRALLDGRKTQTRRIVKPPVSAAAEAEQLRIASPEGYRIHGYSGRLWRAFTGSAEHAVRCPYGVPGDRLWVKETWTEHERFTNLSVIVYAASQRQSWTEMHRDVPIELAKSKYPPRPMQEGWRPSIHMPRWASRLTLAVSDVRVERLQDISESDAEAEGVIIQGPPDRDGGRHFGVNGTQIDEKTAARAFRSLWSGINGPDSWAANPWVWVVTFEVERP